MDTPYDVWTFVPFPDSSCAQGTTTGIGVNRLQGSTRLLIFLPGGGICWDFESCVANPTAAYTDTGYGPTEFQQQFGGSNIRPYFLRSDPANVFRDFNYVYAPYCTGDLHSGSRVKDYGNGGVIHHKGFSNMTAYLRRLVATFPDATQVVIMGTSAGGFGATWNFQQVHAAFSPLGAEVLMINDSWAILKAPYFSLELQQLLDANFGSSANVPGCLACDPSVPSEGWNQIYPYLASTIAGFRGSLISSLRDPSVSGRISQPPGNPELRCGGDGSGPCLFLEGINNLADTVIGPAGPGKMKVFLISETAHVFLGRPPGSVSTNGVTMTDFLRKQLDNDPSWQSVRP